VVRAQAGASLDEIAERQAIAQFDAPADGSSRRSEKLVRHRRSLPAGTFLFVCSDFLEPPPPETWLRALGMRWDLVPVVVQDPLGAELPGRRRSGRPVRRPPCDRPGQAGTHLADRGPSAQGTTRGPARRLLAEFTSLGLDYVVIGIRPARGGARIRRLGRGKGRLPAG
jgi:hypothetical protein